MRMHFETTIFDKGVLVVAKQLFSRVLYAIFVHMSVAALEIAGII